MQIYQISKKRATFGNGTLCQKKNSSKEKGIKIFVAWTTAALLKHSFLFTNDLVCVCVYSSCSMAWTDIERASIILFRCSAENWKWCSAIIRCEVKNNDIELGKNGRVWMDASNWNVHSCESWFLWWLNHCWPLSAFTTAFAQQTMPLVANETWFQCIYLFIYSHVSAITLYMLNLNKALF